MPLVKHPLPSTLPPHLLALQTWKHKVLSSVDLVIPGEFDAPVPTLRQLVQIPVPNQRYINKDNAEVLGTWWLGHVELFATAYVGRDPVTYAKA